MGDQPRDKFRRAIVMLSDGEDNDSSSSGPLGSGQRCKRKHRAIEIRNLRGAMPAALGRIPERALMSGTTLTLLTANDCRNPS